MTTHDIQVTFTATVMQLRNEDMTLADYYSGWIQGIPGAVASGPTANDVLRQLQVLASIQIAIQQGMEPDAAIDKFVEVAG